MERPFIVRLTPNLASFHILYGRTWLQSCMPKFPPELWFSSLRLEALLGLLSSLSLSLASIFASLIMPQFGFNVHLFGVLDDVLSSSVTSRHSSTLPVVWSDGHHLRVTTYFLPNMVVVGFYVLKLIVCKQRYIVFSIKLLLMFIQ